MSLFNGRIIALSLCSALLVACGSEKTAQSVQVQVVQEPVIAETIVAEPVEEIPTDEFEKLIWQAERSLEPSISSVYYFNAATLKYNAGQLATSLSILDNQVIPFTGPKQFDAYLLTAQIYTELKQPLYALSALFKAKRLDNADLNTSQYKLGLKRAAALEVLQNWPSVVRERIKLDSLLPLDRLADNQSQLWQAIQNLTDPEVSFLQKNPDPVLKGWLSISSILRSKSATISMQLNAFKQWQARHPLHPAAGTPPEDFVVIEELDQTKLNKIAIILPMTGRLSLASRAIIDGFLAAYYQIKDANKAQLIFINSDDYQDIGAALNEAYAQDVDVVVGPLSKSSVAQLSRFNLEKPVIALNQLETSAKHPNLHYFSLTSADDILELISFAKQEGATNAGILSLTDPWALRQADEFKQIGEQENINIVSNIEFNNKPKERETAIKELLLINESQQRKKLIERTLNQKVSSIDRPRQDLDYLYFVGHLTDAKQIRPSLDYYYANDNNIPILASHSINNQTPDKNTKKEDIERILFTEVPALTRANSLLDPVSSKVSKNILKRLQAMGADAYLLANRYWVFHKLPQARISANTGLITLDELGVFRKRPELVMFKSGRLINAKNKDIFTITRPKEEGYQ